MKHRKLVHAARFECDFCHKKFFSKHNLKYHFQIHKPKDDRVVYQCTFQNCPKFYFENRNLQAHIRSKHEGRKFTCEVVGCGRALSTKQKLEQHMKLHRSSERAIKKPRKPQAKRKDAGQKRLEIEKILNVNLPSIVKEKIQANQGHEIQVIIEDKQD
jgi:general transcription factor IIIA